MNYDIMRESMLQGFNTYDTYSVLSHVLLPEGFAIKLGLKHRVEKTVLRNALIGRFGEQEEHIHPGVRTVDGSYTQLELEYRGARLDVRSSAAGREQYLLIEPKNEKCRELILFMECGFLWNKPGAAYVREDCVEGVTDSGSIRVYMTGSDTRELHLGGFGAVRVSDLNVPVAVSTGRVMTVDEVRARIDSARAPPRRRVRRSTARLPRRTPPCARAMPGIRSTTRRTGVFARLSAAYGTSTGAVTCSLTGTRTSVR